MRTPARSRSGSTARPAARAGGDEPAGGRLIAVDVDPRSLAPSDPFADLERAAAIRDLLAENTFRPAGRTGRFRLRLSVSGKRLVLEIADGGGAPVSRHFLSWTPLARVIKDYALLCDSYHAAVRSAPPSQIEAIDMGRRGIHDDGATVLRERLAGKVEVDHATARRLFTLVCALRGRA